MKIGYIRVSTAEQNTARRLGISPSTFYRKLKGGRQHD